MPMIKMGLGTHDALILSQYEFGVFFNEMSESNLIDIHLVPEFKAEFL